MKLIEYVRTDRLNDFLKNRDAILGALAEGCKTPSEVAAKLNVSQDMVERRMYRLRRKGILRVVHYWERCGDDYHRVQNE